MVDEKFVDADFDLAKKLLFNSDGIAVADKLSFDHIFSGMSDLNNMRHGENGPIVLDPEEEHTRALMGLVLKVKTRKY